MDRFAILRKILVALGLSEERVEEIVARIQAWFLEDEEEAEETGAGGRQKRDPFPYRLRDDFLSPAEMSFYRVLQLAAGEWALVCPKVSLGDLFYATTGDHGLNRAYRNRIDRKHVDFLLCDPQTVRPLLGVELDDRSHRRADRRERDTFVEGVFKAAGLPIARVPARTGYPVEQLGAFLRRQAGMAEASPAPGPEGMGERGAAEAVPARAGMASDRAQQAAPVQQRPDGAPPCPQCGATMVLRTAARGRNAGGQFWGCPDYPRCRGVVAVEE